MCRYVINRVMRGYLLMMKCADHIAHHPFYNKFFSSICLMIYYNIDFSFFIDFCHGLRVVITLTSGGDIIVFSIHDYLL